ncbi:hypothetical protein [Peptoanaerobacter stomatis]
MNASIKISVIMNIAISVITLLSVIVSFKNKNRKNSKKIKPKKDIKNNKQGEYVNRKNSQQNTIKYVESIFNSKKEDAKEYAEFLSNYTKDKKNFSNKQKNAKLENKKTQRNINKSQQEIIKKIDDIIYNYDKDDKKVKKYAENIKEIFEYEHYDYSKECIEEEFDFDLERAIIYSEILQKPLSLR